MLADFLRNSEELLEAINRSDAEAVYRRLYEDNLPTMRFLDALNIPLPGPLRPATAFLLRTDLHPALQQDDPALEST